MKKDLGYLVLGSSSEGETQLVLCARRTSESGTAPFAVYTGVPYHFDGEVHFDDGEPKISKDRVLAEFVSGVVVIRELGPRKEATKDKRDSADESEAGSGQLPGRFIKIGGVA